MDFTLTDLTLVDASVLPVMQMSITSSNWVRLNWPTNAVGYSLQQNSVLNWTGWRATSNALSTAGTNYHWAG